MRYLKAFTTCLVALALHNTAWAEIYETTDAEGNPEFTDSPAGENSEMVDLPQTNVIDAPQPETQQERQGRMVADDQQGEEQGGGNNTVIVNDNNPNEVYDEALAKQRAFERMDPEAPHEVGDSDSQMPHEVGDFPGEMPREVGDFPDENGGEVEEVPLERENIYHPVEHREVHPVR